MTWQIDGSAASIAPQTVQWQDIQVGTDHQGAPIYSQYKNVVLFFPPASPPHAREWTGLADGASHSINMTQRDGLGFTTVSPVYVQATEPPQLMDIHTTEFTLTVSRATENV